MKRSACGLGYDFLLRGGALITAVSFTLRDNEIAFRGNHTDDSE